MNTKEEILVVAEKRVRRSGYSKLSFRDIAEDLGIKSSSVHYYFKKKSDLGEALVESYTTAFFKSADSIDKSDLKEALLSYIDLYSKTLKLNKSACLCAILGAESITLPKQVAHLVKIFFELNIKWIEQLLEQERNDARSIATLIFSSLEGAMIVATTVNDLSVFDAVASEIITINAGVR